MWFWVPINYSHFLGAQLLNPTAPSTFPNSEARVVGRPGKAFLPTSLLLLVFLPLGHCACYFSVSPTMQNQPPELEKTFVFQPCPQTGHRLLGCGFGPPSQLEAYERSPGPPEQLRDLQRGVISPLARYPSQGTAIWTWHTAPG